MKIASVLMFVLGAAMILAVHFMWGVSDKIPYGLTLGSGFCFGVSAVLTAVKGAR